MRVAKKIASLRTEYTKNALHEATLPPDPLAFFDRWFDEAVGAGLREPNAMVLATADARGRPSSRVVLLKSLHEDAFVFFTNYRSRKGRDLEANPNASLLFFWPELERQVRVEGRVARVPREESEFYFASRPRDSQLGAWASSQSRPIDAQAGLLRQFEAAKQRYAGRAVPCPAWWGGYALTPERIEFWQGRPNRLHDRIVYTRRRGGWKRSRLQP